MKKLKKGFTLIELIAVLVIMAILALIVTPLVMNIIRKARIAADKRSIDAYGRSIELAIAGYLLDNGKFPTEISELTIEYSGNTVECETTQINTDSSVYLTGCTVGGRTVDYAYGKDKSPTYTAYTIGNQVAYNGVDYYVIKDSGEKESTVTLLKAEPLTVAEVNQYGGVGTENNHVNMYNVSNTYAPDYQRAGNSSGYGVMAYYSSETCNIYNSYNASGCKLDYEQSEVKYVVDAWAMDKVPSGLEEARLIQFDELINNFGFVPDEQNAGNYMNSATTPSWIYGNYTYWTMSSNDVSTSKVWYVGRLCQASCFGALSEAYIYDKHMVRPVIVLSKTVLSNH